MAKKEWDDKADIENRLLEIFHEAWENGYNSGLEDAAQQCELAIANDIDRRAAAFRIRNCKTK